MKIENHKEKLREHEDFLDIAIKRGVEISQSAIGFHVSAGAIELLSIALHHYNCISSGKQINHRWLRSKKMCEEKIPVFPNKEKILSIILDIEEKRDSLVYGVPRPKEEIEQLILSFRKLKKIVKEQGIL